MSYSLPPPPGPIPTNSPHQNNTDNNPATLTQSRIPELLGITITMTIFASFFVLGRLYTRLAITRREGYDDLFLALSWIIGIAVMVLIGVLSKFGVGRHIIFIPAPNGHWIQTLGFSVRILHVVVLTTTKISISIFYLRIFQDRLSKILLSCLMAFMTAFTVTLFVEGFFACEFGGVLWAPAGCGLASFRRLSDFFIYGSAALSVSADLFLMGFALWSVIPLGMARVQKLSLYVIISLGWLAIAASLFRAIRTGQLAASQDPTWAAYELDIWASVEVNVGLLCASAPALKPLVRKVFPNFLASDSNFVLWLTSSPLAEIGAPHNAGQSGAMQPRGSDHFPASVSQKQPSSTTRTTTTRTTTTMATTVTDGEMVSRQMSARDLENDGNV